MSAGIVLWDGRVDVLAELVGGLPTWRWRCAPAELATRRQLRAAGLCPGGQEPVGRLVCRRGRRWAWLYRVDLAAPKRTATPAQLAAVGKALAARRWCPSCRRDVGYCVPPVALAGRCWDCAEAELGGCAMPREQQLDTAVDRLATALLASVGIHAPSATPEQVRGTADLLVKHTGVDRVTASRVAAWVAPQFVGLAELIRFAQREAEAAEAFLVHHGLGDAYAYQRRSAG